MTSLDMLKYNLGKLDTAQDEYLRHLIEAAQQMIAREGIDLDSAPESEAQSIVTMYAAYLYRRRAGDDQSMPRMLRYALNNLLFAQKAAPDGGDAT